VTPGNITRSIEATSLRVLQERGSVNQAALTKIFRQQVPALREAVEDLSRGDTEAGFNELEAAGVIHEVGRHRGTPGGNCESAPDGHQGGEHRR